MGEITTEHPGYLIAQDTYYVGTYKGLSVVYEEKLRQGDYLEEEEKMRVQELKTECETKSEEINKILGRIKYGSSVIEYGIKSSKPSELEVAGSSQPTGIIEVEQEFSDQSLIGVDST